MRQVTIVRSRSSNQGTPGRILIDGRSFCFSLELPWKDNASNVSCIPTGSYIIEPFKSARFGEVYLVLDTLPRTYILFHAGNWAGSTAHGFRTHSHGCVLLGNRRGLLENQKAVLASRLALSRFKTAIGRGKARLEIIDLD